MIEQMKEFVGETRQAALSSAAAHFGVAADRLEVFEPAESLRVAGLGSRVLLLVAPKAVESELGDVGKFVRAVLEDLGLNRGLRLDESEEEGRIIVRAQSQQLEEAERKVGGVEASLSHLADRAAQELLDEEASAAVVLAREPRGRDRDRDGSRRSGGGDRGRDRDRPRGRDRDRDRGGDRDRGDRNRDSRDSEKRGGGDKEQELEAAARRAAEEVRKSGEPRTLAPMGSRDRWVVHNAVKDISGVTSMSVGEGDEKRVKIVPD